MVKSKKLLSLFLAVVMVLSVFTVMASAYTRVETEGTADIDIKYTVEKVGVLPETAAGSAELAGDNFYAVTIWMKSAKAIDLLTAPIHYNKTLFAPISLSDGECTYPVGAGMDQDSYYSEMGEGAIYVYSLGDYMNNTGMYKANGTTATTKALAKCIGLGNSNASPVKVTSEIVSPDHPLYNKWGAGLPSDTGVVYANIVANTAVKNAYFNTLEGITTYTDWVNMFTLYFEAIADDVAGAEFGVYTDDCFTVDGNYDASGYAYYASTADYDARVPSMNVVSNAVVEEVKGPSPVVPASSQIRFRSLEQAGPEEGGPTEAGTATFDVRSRAMITNDNFDALIEYNYDTKATNIEKVGFVYYSGYGMSLEYAARVIGGEEVDGYTNAPVSHIQKKADGYYWTCLVTDALYDGILSAVGYIVVDGETYFFDEVSSTEFSGLYDEWYDDYKLEMEKSEA